MVNNHGGAREGAGRKIGSTKNGTGYKTGRIVISCTKDQELEIKNAAKREDKKINDFILSLFYEKYKKN